jgi:hypothetical protein
MLAAIAALLLSAPPATAIAATLDAPESRRPAADAPAVIMWDDPRRAGEIGQLATIWTPIVDGKVPHRSDVESAVVLDMIEQAKLGDEVVAVIGGDEDQADGGIAGTGPTIIMTLIQAPSSVVVPAQASLERVVAYLQSILSDQVTIRIGVAFRSTGAPNILGITASRWAPQTVSPTLASMIRAGSAQGTPDDARFLPEPPAPYGSGPNANARLRVMYNAPQASNRPRFASEDRVYWTYPQLKAAWQYSIPTSTAYDAQISVNTNAAIFQNLDFDPSDGIPPGKYSFEDLIVRQVVQSLGWTCAASVNLRQDMSVMDMYRFSADRVSLTSDVQAPDTGTGLMIQPPDAFFTLTGCSGSCDDVQRAIDTSVAAATPYTDPNLGNFRIDLNPGVMRPLRFNLVSEAFDDIYDQYTFVEQFLPVPPANSGFAGSPFGWAVRLQFGGPGIWDDAQLTPPPAPALRTLYTDAFQQQYRTQDTGTNGIATWVTDATLWGALGSGIDGSVNALQFFDDGSGEALYAGGSFRSASGIAADRIARWNGTSWQPVGTGLNGIVKALAVFDDGAGPALYAGGTFTAAGSTPVARIAKWNGSTWSAVGNGLNNAVNALCVYDDGAGPALYAGGAFTLAIGNIPANSVVVNRIAKWDGSAWSQVSANAEPADRGFNGPVNALAVVDDGIAPVLYAGGRFSVADTASASNVAFWDGAAWQAAGSGTSDQVWSLALFDIDFTGPIPPVLAAGGDFLVAGGVTVNRVATWDGTAWAALGSGANDSVRALAQLDKGTDAALGAGGDFTSIGGINANRMAYWTGAVWEPMGNGLSCTVSAIAQAGTGPTWTAIAGGAFSGAYCVLVDFEEQFPGYMPRLVAMGMGDGLVNLNFVTGVDNDPTNEGPDGIDLEVPILSNQASFSSFLVQVAGPTEIQYLMGDQQLSQATTYYSRSGVTGAPCNPTGDFLSPTELKILNCLGWAVNPVPTAADCE